VTLIHRRDELRASKIMQERAFAEPRISFLWNTVVDGVVGDAAVEKLVLRDLVTGDVSELPVQGMFVAIGHDPNTAIVRGQLDLDAEGYVVTAPSSTATSVDGVFAAGDVQDHVFRQAITAAGTGCMAAIEAERWLGATARSRFHRLEVRESKCLIISLRLPTRRSPSRSAHRRTGHSRLLGRVVRAVPLIAPVLEEIADEHAGKLTVAKLTSTRSRPPRSTSGSRASLRSSCSRTGSR